MPTLNTLLLCSLLLAAPQGGTPPHPAPAQPATEKQDPARTRELDLQYQMLCDTYARSEVEWNDLLRVYAGEAQKRNETLAKHPAKQYWERFQKLANDGQGRALVWMAGHAENMYPERETATQQKLVLFRKLIDEHASDPWALETVVSLSLQRYWLETKGVQSLLEDFVKQTKNREFAATALSKEMAILSGAASKTEEQKQADEVRDRIIHDYSDTEVGKKLAERLSAKDSGVQPGLAAPDFTGKDVDGAEISLASARGKVVLLDFWGFWSAQSRAMIAHLNELAAQHAADPFVILGVATDEDAVRFRELSKEQKVGWRSVWDGGRAGPVSRLYQVHAFPSLLLLDPSGKVRKVWVIQPSDKVLDEEIAAALAAAKAPPK